MPFPRTLTTGPLTTIVTPAGGGGVLLGAHALTRWTPDGVADADGVWLYVRDVDDGLVWSAGLQPTPRRPDAYRMHATVRRVEIARTDGDVSIATDVCTDGDADLRRYTVANRGPRTRTLELTTYAEAVLNTPAGDRAHPAFSKLFVQTELVGDAAAPEALLARRRLRSPDDRPLWLAHALVGDGAPAGFETDRRRFVGRGRTVAQPRALDADARLEGGVGNVLDPVLALRRTVTLAPGATVRVLAVLAGAETRDAALAAVRRYPDVGAAERAFGTGGETGETIVPPPASRGGAHRPLEPRDGDGASVPPSGAEPLRFFNGHGGFAEDGSEYVIRVAAGARDGALPPLPWVNVVANEEAGFIASETGAGCTWAANSRENRVTPWSNDPVSDPHGEALWVRDDEAGVFWSPMPGPVPGAGAYEVRHGFGYTRFTHEGMGIAHDVVQFVPRSGPVKLTRVRLTNTGDRPRRLSLASYAHLVLGVFPHETGAHVVTEHDPATGAILAANPERGEFSGRVAFAAIAGGGDDERSLTADRLAFLGAGGTVASPAALRADGPLDGRTGGGLEPCAAFLHTFALQPGETAERVVLLGEAEDRDAARALLATYATPSAAAAALEDVRAFWQELLGRVQVETPAPELDLMANGWLAYQNLSCRVWGRSAFYQSGGAYGFRDQLQDASALVYLDPALTRRQIVLHAAHQFAEGDVLHWWHPPTSKGMRTRFADDLLWLPYIASFYVGATGDRTVWDEPARFVAARPLAPGEDEAFLVPEDAGTTADVYTHCCLAIDRSLTRGAHGLPLMGVGDWNDGMNRVGREGRGESVWLGFFLHHILADFIPVCRERGDDARAERYAAFLRELGATLNDTGWDGGWYRRAYYDDGTPLGSAANDECRIDTIAQAWSVLAGAAPPERAAAALDAMEHHLVSEREGIIRLLTPAFDRTPHDPGYIKGYLPGVRENGGQYTHAALWAVRALAEAGRCERAAPLLAMLSPVSHGRTPEEIATYMTEPYVVAADVYGVAPHVGRGGWTWYTGSAGWMHRVILESVLGFRIEGGERLVLRPCVPADWPGFTVRYRTEDGTTYEIVARRGDHDDARTTVHADGEALALADGAAVVPLRRDGAAHRVELRLGADIAPRYAPRDLTDL